MDKMKDKLSDVSKHKMKIKINSEKLKEDMHNFRKNLDKIGEFEIDIDINIDDFPKEGDFEFEMDIPDIEINQEEIEKDLKKFRFNMKKHGDEAENMSSFISSLKEELKKDGYIRNDSDEIDVVFENNRIIINGRELKDEQYDKYSRMLKEHSGKDKDAKVKIRIKEK